MTKPVRFASAISFVALATALAGCAAPQAHVSSSGFGGKAADVDVGLATRAMAALNANDIPAAISFAERAVEKTPDDAGFRTLLGNCYFAGGRFASAEAAYKDALSIYSNQPQAVLKLALAQIAQGKNAEALSFLEAGKAALDPSDYGLALALAGQPADAISVLEPIARSDGADARVRQNLALSYAFAGNWDNARAIAAQDVPADQLETRVRQWMQLANPAKSSDQVAALIGVTPAASDPGQPVRLALHTPAKGQPPLADAAPAPAPVQAAPAPEPQVAEAPPVEAAPVAPISMAQAAAASPEAPAAFAAMMPTAPAPKPARKAAQLHRASAPAGRAPVRAAVLRKGNVNAVVQLGAFGNSDRVAAAWSAAAHRFGALRDFTPVSARFDSPRGTFYRLSVKGFASVGEANALCSSIRRNGGQCFVRNVAGDKPVEIASR